MAIPEHIIQTIWQRQNFWSRLTWLCLTPFALGFSAIVRSRNFLYDFQLLPIAQPAPKVISVGNLTVGGTGKTPFVLWLAQALHTRNNYRVGILTRGYKGTKSDTTIIGSQGEIWATPDEVGDEGVMLAQTSPGVVIAGKNRLEAAELARQTFESDVVILDDGFQHRKLKRDVDLLLINSSHGQHGLGNGWLLPAGPLREPLSAIRRADIVVFTKGRPQPSSWRKVWSALDPQGMPSIFYGDLSPTSLVQSVQSRWQELPLTLLHHRRVLAVAGIADPLPFYTILHEQEADLTEVLSFPDHHTYTQADWQTILTASRTCDLVVTTEKDLVKLEQFPFPAGKLVALRVCMQVRDADKLLTRIERQLEYGTEKG